MSYCTQHPGKEAVGACSECGHLVCKACYTEVKDRVYCSSCANKLFVVKEQPPSPPVTGEKNAPSGQKRIEAAQPAVPPPPVASPKPAVPPQPVASPQPAVSQQPAVPPKPVVPPQPVVPLQPAVPSQPVVSPQPAMSSQPVVPPSAAPSKAAPPPKAEVKPVVDRPLEIEKPIVKAPDAARKQPAAATSQPKDLSMLWWLAPVLLAFIGGLAAWFSNKSREPGKARAMLWTGIGLTAVYAAVIFIFAILPGIQTGGSGTIIFDSYRDGTWQVWVMNPDGSDPQLFTAHENTSKYFNVQSGWSSSLKRLSFCSSRDKNSEIYTIDANVSNDTNLTKNNFADQQPDWSAVNNKIAFISNRDGNNEIYVMDADGGNLQRLTVSKPNDQRPRWSPDGNKIVFYTDRDGNFEIYVMNADGSNQLRLTTNEAWDGQARWSPDGKRIAFVSDRDGNPEIYLMDADGKNQKRTTFNSAKDYYPCFSPDGIKIVYHSNIAGNDDIYVMNADGGNQKRLTDDKAHDQIPLWISQKLKPPAMTTPPVMKTIILGSEASTANKNASGKDNVHYIKFLADRDGSADVIRVYSSESGAAKAAIYDHDPASDRPVNRLSSNDQPTACAANTWNTIDIPPVSITKGRSYWLGFNTDTTGVVMNGAGTQKVFFLKAPFEDFTFPTKAPSDNGTFKINASICAYGNP